MVKKNLHCYPYTSDGKETFRIYFNVDFRGLMQTSSGRKIVKNIEGVFLSDNPIQPSDHEFNYRDLKSIQEKYNGCFIKFSDRSWAPEEIRK